MSRRRYISTDISLDVRVNRLADIAGDFAVLLYTWMIPHAKDDTSLPTDPEELMYLVIPGRRDKTAEDVIAALDAMRDCGLIEWDGDDLRFPAEAFYRYQTYIQPKNRRGVDQQESAQDSDSSGKQRETPRNAASPSPSLSLPHSLSSSSLRSEDTSIVRKAASPPDASPHEIERFDAVWDAYPKSRRIGRAKCLTIWRGLKIDAATFEDVLAGLDAWKASNQWQDEQYVVHLERWLRDRRWEVAPPSGKAKPRYVDPNIAFLSSDGPDENGYGKVILG